MTFTVYCLSFEGEKNLNGINIKWISIQMLSMSQGKRKVLKDKTQFLVGE